MATATATKTDDRVEELLERLTDHVEILRSSEGWTEWLRFAASFHRYSANNQLLIAIQCPEATHVTGYGAKDGSTGWLKLGRQVRKGEKAIHILAPKIRHRTETDEVTGEERKVKYVGGFRTVAVFDISQTEGDDAPVTSDEMWRDALDLNAISDHGEAAWAALQIAAEKLGRRVILDEVDLGGKAELGYWSRGSDAVHVRQAHVDQMAAVLVHELSHSIDPELPQSSYEASELVAESSAHIVSTLLGIDTTPVSAIYLAHFSEDIEALRAVQDRTLKVARRIIEALGLSEEGE